MSENKSYLKKKRASKKTRPLDQPNSPLGSSYCFKHGV